MYLPHSIVVYCASIYTRVLQVFSPTVGCTVSDVINRFTHVQADFTTEKSGVAAETVELVLQFLECFPVQDSFIKY